MSQAAAKIEAAPAGRANRPREPSRVHGNGGVRGWNPAPAAGGLRIGRRDDPHEAQADQAAHQALSASARGPALPGAAASLPARRDERTAESLPARIAAAGAEGRALAEGERDFFEPRFGHRFDAVRIHSGPAAAAAAAAAGAQAFTLGRDIYFGEGQFRPQTSGGRELLAHELAHTLQDRPNVVARRALDTSFDLPESAPAVDSGPQPDAGADPGDLAMLVEAGPGRDMAARDRLAGLDPAARGDAMAALRRKLPASDLQKADALGEAVEASEAQKRPAPNPMPEIREGEAPAATVIEDKSALPPSAPPTHQRAESAAAAKMQEAVKTTTAEVPLEGAAAMPPGGLDTAGVGSGGAGMAPADAAPGVAQNVVAMLGAGLAELEAAENQPVRFREESGRPAGDPEVLARVTQSRSLASGFVGGTADKIRAVISAALAVPAELTTALGGARQAVATQAATQGGVLKGGAETGRKAIREQTSRVRGAIAARHSGADRDAARDVGDARGRAARAYGDAAGGIGRRADREKSRIRQSYDDARWPMIGVGFETGGLARAAAADRAASKRSKPPKDGKSSILDGPLHDNRLDAEADAAEKVGDEYAKSFEKSAAEQADKLPQSRPEVLAKVDEITLQVHTGFAGQLAQIIEGANAIETGAKTHSRQAATHIRAALDANATQSQQALDTGEKEQGAALQRQADAAQGMLDQSVAGALSRFGDGVFEAVHQLTQGLGGFIASTAEIPAPESDELATALAAADPTSPLVTMKDQVSTVGPTLAATLSEGQQASGAALAAAAQAATQGFAGSAAAFVKTAGGINRQAATGFARLGAGNKRSAANLAEDAEAGFKDAAGKADSAYSLFGDKVGETFRTGRRQMFDGLWSRDNRAKLAKTMKDNGEEAAKHVQPRWKKVLKWVIKIVVVVAVIAITVASAGSLGPVGFVLLGAALGAGAGAVQTIAENVIDGEPTFKGVVKAMVVGAVAGAVGGIVGGAGGALVEGVEKVGVRLALEGGVNFVAGVAGDVAGRVVVGEPITWSDVLKGALVGVGIGAGLRIGGAIRGRIGAGAEPAAPPPTIEPTPPPPAGRIRSALEATKILKPRPGAAAPEVEVDAGAEPAPEPTPAPAAEPTLPGERGPTAAQPSGEAPSPAAAPPESAPAPSAPTPAPTSEAVPAAARPLEPAAVQPTEPPAATPAAETAPSPTAELPPEPARAPAETAPPSDAATQPTPEPSNVRDIRSARGRRYDPRVREALGRTPRGARPEPLREAAPGAEAPAELAPQEIPEAAAEPAPQEVPEAVAEPAPQEFKRAAGDYETVAMASGRGRRPPPKLGAGKPTRPAPTPPTGGPAPRPPAMVIEPTAPRAPGAAGAEPSAAVSEPTTAGAAPETAAPAGPGGATPEREFTPQEIDEFLGTGGPGEPPGPIGAREATPPPRGFKAEGPPVSIKEVVHPELTGGAPRPHQVLEIGSGQVRTNLGLPPDPTGVRPADPNLVEVTETDLTPTRPGVRQLDATKPLDPDLHGQFDTVLINNPRHYTPDLPELAKALRPDGRIIIQGRAGQYRASTEGVNPEFHKLYWDAVSAVQKANPGWDPSRGIQELPLEYQMTPVPSDAPPVPANAPPTNPGVLPGGLEVRIDLTPGPQRVPTRPAHIMGSDFHRTTGVPSGGGPNARIIYTKAGE